MILKQFQNVWNESPESVPSQANEPQQLNDETPYEPVSTQSPSNVDYEPASNQLPSNPDTLHAAIDQKDFSQLLDMAQSKFYSEACAQSFKRRYGNHEIIIENDSHFNVGDYWNQRVTDMKKSLSRLSPFKSSTFSAYITDNYIKFHDINTVLKTLRHFGHVIQKLTINLSSVDTVHSKEIIRHVDEYCTGSVVELQLGVNAVHALKHFSRSFNKVEHVSFEGSSSSSKGQTIPTNQLFPALRSMSLKISFDNDYLAYYFPHVKHVHIDLTSSRFLNIGVDNVGYLYGFLTANPQIYRIDLIGYVPEAMDQISVMPHLNHLTFKWDTPITKEFRSESITKFTMVDNSHAIPENLNLPNIQELQMYLYNTHFDDWVAFMNEHQSLKRFYLNFDVLNEDQFPILTSILQNLEEMYVYSMHGRHIAVADIIEFINNHDKLMIFYLDVCNETDKKILKSAFSREWTINDNHDGLSFQRK